MSDYECKVVGNYYKVRGVRVVAMDYLEEEGRYIFQLDIGVPFLKSSKTLTLSTHKKIQQNVKRFIPRFLLDEDDVDRHRVVKIVNDVLYVKEGDEKFIVDMDGDGGDVLDQEDLDVIRHWDDIVWITYHNRTRIIHHITCGNESDTVCVVM